MCGFGANDVLFTSHFLDRLASFFPARYDIGRLVSTSSWVRLMTMTTATRNLSAVERGDAGAAIHFA